MLAHSKGMIAMLVLTRKKGQSIIINENIEVTIVDVQKDSVRLAIQAPKSVSIHRKEVFEEIQEENRKAANISNVSLNELFKK